ncbi:RagB/SusD family nutrient uptake outer membrane protein [Chitinophaga tropicalis]|uniref:RagB/SusD family nutrient uptake outer membrane protein n=1 Tax=Chitinophaga tropicalis TaxID=2683588 RepID=A0A7K1UDN8_9BACT|nr:RagB/SusD family nutrient uptake outer membrane protein [Chitinophaga tropicalis]MVT12390.1 RagB/SusD family nutrient uptake outer membrane protein [Chitinophaga tropicalis]
MKRTIWVIMFLCLGTSCNKWLDVKPQDGIIRDNYWQNKEQLQAAVIGCYASLLDNSLVQNLFVWGELRADMVAATLNAAIDEVNIMEANILATNYYTSWAPLYRTINYCNTVITYAAQVMETDKTLTQQQLDAYLSEAYAMRALMYFYLLRSFGEVPLQLKATSGDGTLEQLKKSSQQEVHAQIMKDLAFAEQHAVETYGNVITDKGRITKYTVYAIEADAYLWMEQYDNCIAACDKIINSNRFGLMDGSAQAQWFNSVFFTGNSNESIFEFQFDQQKQNPFYFMFGAANNRFIGSPRVMDEVYGIDLIDATKKDIRGDGGSIRAADQMIWKFAGASSGTTMQVRGATESYAHWFVYRYADVLLLKAEALAWVNKGQEALDLVKVIRDRARALVLTERTPDPLSPVDVSSYILEERAREFAFEGKRWYDVLRNAKRNNYSYLSIMLDMVAMNAPGNMQQSILSKYRDVRSHYFPINQYELQADKLLEQNPYYQ